MDSPVTVAIVSMLSAYSLDALIALPTNLTISPSAFAASSTPSCSSCAFRLANSNCLPRSCCLSAAFSDALPRSVVAFSVCSKDFLYPSCFCLVSSISRFTASICLAYLPVPPSCFSSSSRIFCSSSSFLLVSSMAWFRYLVFWANSSAFFGSSFRPFSMSFRVRSVSRRSLLIF